MNCEMVPKYDTQQCCQECHAGTHENPEVYRVSIRGSGYVEVCENAFRFARKWHMITSMGTIRGASGSISKKRPAIRLNHK